MSIIVALGGNHDMFGNQHRNISIFKGFTNVFLPLFLKCIHNDFIILIGLNNELFLDLISLEGAKKPMDSRRSYTSILFILIPTLPARCYFFVNLNAYSETP